MIRQLIRRPEAIRRFGLLDGLLYLLGRVLEKASAGRVRLIKYVLVAQPVMQSPMLPPRRGRDIVVGQVLPGSPLLDALPRPTSVIHNRYRQGGICLCATKDGTPIGYIWFNLGPYEEDEVRCRFAPTPAGRSSWDYDVYVAPQYRGSFTFARLWDAANEHLRERRVDWSMSRISAFNAESLASHSRLQAQRVGTATFLEIGRIQLMFSSLPPRFDASWNPRRRPQLDVPAPEASHHKG